MSCLTQLIIHPTAIMAQTRIDTRANRSLPREHFVELNPEYSTTASRLIYKSVGAEIGVFQRDSVATIPSAGPWTCGQRKAVAHRVHRPRLLEKLAFLIGLDQTLSVQVRNVLMFQPKLTTTLNRATTRLRNDPIDGKHLREPENN